MSDSTITDIRPSPEPVIYQPKQSAIEALKDVVRGAKRVNLWWALATEDLLQRYKRSAIGMLWILLSFGLFLSVKFAIFSVILDVDVVDYLKYLATGYFLWIFIQRCLVDGCATFISSEGWIKGRKLPFSIFAFQMVTRNILTALIQVLVVAVILVLGGTEWTPNALISLFIVVILYPINAFFISILFGVITVRSRDFFYLVQSLNHIFLFLSPVLWQPEKMGALWDNLLVYNPIAHFLISVRTPLIYGTIPWTSVFVVLGVTAALGILSMAALQFAYRRIVYWI
tara:strand:- start:18496 stop:19350 length:855 start_codon:yes stop_codon:yes gene_type:complete